MSNKKRVEVRKEELLWQIKVLRKRRIRNKHTKITSNNKDKQFDFLESDINNKLLGLENELLEIENNLAKEYLKKKSFSDYKKPAIYLVLLLLAVSSILFVDNGFFNDDGLTGAIVFDEVVRILAVPTHGTPIINSTDGTNNTYQNITAYNVSTADGDSDPVKNIFVL